MPFYEPRLAPLPSCFAAEECPGARGKLKRNHSFPGYITFFMASTGSGAGSCDEIENISDAKEDNLGMVCEDPSPQVWPDTDEEFFLGEHVAYSGNGVDSTYFQTPSESFCTQPPGSAITRKPVSWADMEDEIGLDLDTSRSQSTIAIPELCQTWWPQPEATEGCRSAGDATAMPLADAVGDPEDIEPSSRTQPLLLNLESTLPAPFSQHRTIGLHARPCPSSLCLPHLFKHATAQALASHDTPHSCAAASLQSTAATPLSRASPLSTASPESENDTPQSQARVASFKTQETPTCGRLSFCLDDSASCLGVSIPNRRVPAAVGRQTSNMAANSKTPGASGPSTRFTMQDRKAFGALALKKARAMLPAVSLKPTGIADLATCALEPGSASSPATFEGHTNFKATDVAQATKRPLPTLLQGRSGGGMLKSKCTLGQEKLVEIGVAR